MARISKEQQLANLHAEALSEFDNIQSALRDERLQCLQDRRFYSLAGSQWEGPLLDQYENKPKFEVNKVHLAVIRIINEYRNNRITVDFTSKDGEERDDRSPGADVRLHDGETRRKPLAHQRQQYRVYVSYSGRETLPSH